MGAAIVICMFLCTFVPSFGLYWYVCRPLKRERAQLRQQLAETLTDLSDERRMRADIIKWIDIESGKYTFIARALKQRVDERLEHLRQLRIERDRAGVKIKW